jgi:tight adherence protein B
VLSWIAIALAAAAVVLGGGRARVPARLERAVAARWERRRVARQARARAALLPLAVTALAAQLRAGRSFAQAVAAVAGDLPSPIAEAMAAAGDAIALGAAPGDALAALGDGEDVRLLAAAVRLQLHAGGDLALVLEELAEALVRREEQRQAAAVATAQARYTGRMVTALPVFGVVSLRAVDPAAFALLVSRPLGWVALATAALLAAGGHLLIRRLAAVHP